MSSEPLRRAIWSGVSGPSSGPSSRSFLSACRRTRWRPFSGSADTTVPVRPVCSPARSSFTVAPIGVQCAARSTPSASQKKHRRR